MLEDLFYMRFLKYNNKQMQHSDSVEKNDTLSKIIRIIKEKIDENVWNITYEEDYMTKKIIWKSENFEIECIGQKTGSFWIYERENNIKTLKINWQEINNQEILNNPEILKYLENVIKDIQQKQFEETEKERLKVLQEIYNKIK